MSKGAFASEENLGPQDGPKKSKSSFSVKTLLKEDGHKKSSSKVAATGSAGETSAQREAVAAAAAAADAPAPVPVERKNTVFVNKAEVKVYLNEGSINCEASGLPQSKPFPLATSEVVNAKLEERTIGVDRFHTVHVSYLDRVRPQKTVVAIASVDFTHPEPAEEFRKSVVEAAKEISQTALTNITVVINPLSGKQKAQSIYDKYVGPVLAVAGVKVTRKVVTSPGSVRKIAEEIDVATTKAIICISGDGTVHDLLNGLMKRKDWQDATKIPVGVIPAGQSNALAVSLRGPDKAFDAAVVTMEFLRNKTSQLDVLSVTKGDEVRYSVGGLHFGFVDDVPSRWLQNISFKIKSIFSKPKFLDQQVKLSLLTVADDKAKIKQGADTTAALEAPSGDDPLARQLPGLDKDVPSEWKVIENAAGVFSSKLPWGQKGYALTPYASPTDGAIDVCVVNGGTAKPASAAILAQAATGTHIDAQAIQYFKVQGLRIEPKGQTPVYVDGENLGTGPVQVELHRKIFTTFFVEKRYVVKVDEDS